MQYVLGACEVSARHFTAAPKFNEAPTYVGLTGLCGCLAAAALTLGPANATEVAPPPPEAFGAVPVVSSAKLSPDGGAVVWLRKSDTEDLVVMYDLNAQHVKRTLNAGPETKVREVRWIDNETVLVSASTTLLAQGAPLQYEYFRYLAANMNGDEPHWLLASEPASRWVTGMRLVAVHISKPKTVIMAMWQYSEAAALQPRETLIKVPRSEMGVISNLFEVDTASGQGKLIARGTQFTNSWVVDRAGSPIARGEYDTVQHRFSVWAKIGPGWREVLQQNDRRPLNLVGTSEDGSAIIAIGDYGDGPHKVVEFPLDGSSPRVLIADPIQDVEWLQYDDIANKPIYAVLSGVHPEVRWIDKQAEARYRSLARSFGDREIDSYDESQDKRRALVRAESPSHPPIYYVVDFTAHQASILGEEYPALANVALGEVLQITLPARDGTPIPAFLTLPPGADGKHQPLVVVPHGGPSAHDEYRFEWFRQFLASRGYAVLQPQYRGSTGFGEAFREAGVRQWGGLMQDDVTDSVKALIDQGIADPKRICIVGMSYGGFSALAGAAFTPDLYVCAVSVNGVTDIPAMSSYLVHKYGEGSYPVNNFHIDVGYSLDPKWIDRSPIRGAQQIKAPILLVYATDDTVVPIGQAENMAQALKAAGKQVTLVKLRSEDHWLSKSTTRIQVLREIDRFLKANL